MITLIATVLNEGDNMAVWLDSFLEQTRQADEIVIVDGGSNDNTVDILHRYEDRLPIQVIVQAGCNISEGRNTAIAAAKGDILAITDAGVRLTDTWLEKLTQPLIDNPGLTVSCGFFKADAQTTFEAAMGAAVLPLAHEIDPTTFLPSSRSVAVRKAAVEQIAAYPEWLDYCEDLVFDLRLKASQPPFAFVPEAFVYFRPRNTMSAYFKQYYRYARGDGKANLWLKRHILRYLTYLVIAPIILALGLFIHPLLWGLFLIAGALYFYQPYLRLPAVMKDAPNQSIFAWLSVILLIPVIRVVGDIAKMTGYPVGWRWRLQNRPPDWRILEQKN
jgi:glycosyltransferase involved in cell wall biosynthesis